MQLLSQRQAAIDVGSGLAIAAVVTEQVGQGDCAQCLARSPADGLSDFERLASSSHAVGEIESSRAKRCVQVLQPTKGQHRQRGRHAFAVTQTAENPRPPPGTSASPGPCHPGSPRQCREDPGTGPHRARRQVPGTVQAPACEGGIASFGCSAVRCQLPTRFSVRATSPRSVPRARRIECRMEVRTGALVVARTPQPAEVELRRADQRLVADSCRQRGGLLEISPAAHKIPQQLQRPARPLSKSIGTSRPSRWAASSARSKSSAAAPGAKASSA